MKISENLIDKVNSLKDRTDPELLANAISGSYGESFIPFNKSALPSAKMQQPNPIVKRNDDPSKALFTKIIPNKDSNLRRGDGISTILAKIYVLLRSNLDEDRKHRELEHNFEKEKQDEKEKWNKELVEAIKSLKGTTYSKVEKKEQGGLFESLFDLLKGGLNKIFDSLVSKLKALAAALIAGILSRLAKLLPKELFKEAEKTAEKVKPEEKVKGEEKVEEKVKDEAHQKLEKLGEASQKNTTAKGLLDAEAKAGGKAAEKGVAKEAFKGAAKGVGKAAAKVLPLVGSALSFRAAYERVGEGDYYGATIDAASGILNLGGSGLNFGTSIGLDAYNYSRDVGLVKKNTGAETLDKGFRAIDKVFGIDRTPNTPIVLPKPIIPPKVEPMPAKSTQKDQGKTLQNSVKENEDLKKTKKTTVVLDNSKTITNNSKSSPPIVVSGSADVRTDDDTINRLNRKNLRPV